MKKYFGLDVKNAEDVKDLLFVGLMLPEAVKELFKNEKLSDEELVLKTIIFLKEILPTINIFLTEDELLKYFKGLFTVSEKIKDKDLLKNNYTIEDIEYYFNVINEFTNSLADDRKNEYLFFDLESYIQVLNIVQDEDYLRYSIYIFQLAVFYFSDINKISKNISDLFGKSDFLKLLLEKPDKHELFDGKFIVKK